jgi:hypothetical protein
MRPVRSVRLDGSFGSFGSMGSFGPFGSSGSFDPSGSFGPFGPSGSMGSFGSSGPIGSCNPFVVQRIATARHAVTDSRNPTRACVAAVR